MEQDFCYWDARNLPDTIILLCYLCVSVIVLVVTIFRFKKIKRFGDSGRRIARIYFLIILWSVTFCYQMTLGTSIYFSRIKQDPESDALDMKQYSRLYARVDLVPAFVITTLFLSICKIFFNGLYLRIYYYLRLALLIVCFALLNIFMQSEHDKTFLKLNVFVLIIDCLLTSIILSVSLQIFRKRFTVSDRFQQNDMDKLKMQYLVMIIVSGLRIINATIFVALPYMGIDYVDGACTAYFDDNRLRTIFFNGLGNLFNHLLPVVWVLKIYNIQSYQKSMNGVDEESDRMDLVQSFLR